MQHWMCTLVALGLAAAAARGANPELPEVMRLEDGTPVETPVQWEARRAGMRDALLRHQYGRVPTTPSVRAEDVRTERSALAGLETEAACVRATLVFGPGDALRMEACCWLPGDATGPVPVVLAIEPAWWPDPFQRRGIVQRLLRNGYGFAGFDHNALASYEDPDLRAAHDAYPGYDWGTVAVAAWGCGVTLNWLEAVPGVDAKHVAVWGHSRRGKSALLAGLLDERFAAVLPHMSGMAGSALYRVRGPGAQELEGLLERYWLAPGVFDYIDREEDLPFDQHWALALIAPRPLMVHVGLRDRWGNPPGERAAVEAARPVYAWLGQPGRVELSTVDRDHTDPNGPEGGASWERVVDFLDRQWAEPSTP